MADPTYFGYEAPTAGGTAAAVAARRSPTVQNAVYPLQQGAVVYAVPVEEVADPTYSGYETPTAGVTAAAACAPSSLTIMPIDKVAGVYYA